VGDAGEIVAAGGTFVVSDTQKIQSEVFGHHGALATGRLAVGDKVAARVAAHARAHHAQSLGHAFDAQGPARGAGAARTAKGSLVDADKTRFDFSHDAPMSDEQLRRVEAMVNAEILRNEATSARIMKFDDAVKGGAMALFGEKYGDEVRVLDIGSSRELCGGTHVARTGDIGFFKITSQGGVAAGVRRVEATTGEGALAWVQAMEDERHFVEGFYQASGDALKEKLKAEREEKRALGKGARAPQVQARSQPGRRSRGSGRRSQGRQGPRGLARRSGCEDPARDARQAEGQAEVAAIVLVRAKAVR